MRVHHYLLVPYSYITRLPQRYMLMLLVPNLLVLIGTVGYYTIEEDYNLFDSLYMTVITLTTVGYGETRPLSTEGRIFTMFLLLGGVFTLFYTASEILRLIVSGEIQDLMGRQLMARSLQGMENHLIVCGYGRMGRLICQEFSKGGLPFVLIDRRPDILNDFHLPHGIPLMGDATSDEILRRAGVEKARALVTVAASDADNLYIVMSARLLNDRLFIVARTEQEHAEQKLRRAGANRVVSPYAIGGFRVAQAVLRPNVVDFIELATRTEHLDLQIEEAQVKPTSKLVGVTLQASRIRQDLGVIIVAIKKRTTSMVFNPPGEAVIEAGDTLIALGHRQHLDELEKLADRTPKPT